MESYGLASVASITIIVYLVGEAVKLLPFVKNEWIPVICGFVGAVMGVPAMRIMPDYPAQDYLTAVAVGAVSGFAATGVHQVYKQIYKGKNTGDEEAE